VLVAVRRDHRLARESLLHKALAREWVPDKSGFYGGSSRAGGGVRRPINWDDMNFPDKKAWQMIAKRALRRRDREGSSANSSGANDGTPNVIKMRFEPGRRVESAAQHALQRAVALAAPKRRMRSTEDVVGCRMARRRILPPPGRAPEELYGPSGRRALRTPRRGDTNACRKQKQRR
jgi:hypothetical protein